MTIEYEEDTQYRSDTTVKLVQKMGGDETIVWAARVSTDPNLGEGITFEDLFNASAEGRALEAAPLEERDEGLIRYLMREKHGSPFEHNGMTFYGEITIFSARELMRHRIGFSYNEWSGRYSELEPVFWIPGEGRGLQNVGTSSKPKMDEGTYEQRKMVPALMKMAYKTSWYAYKTMLKLGVANEVARAVLPVGIYTKLYVTMNLRSALNFLSLRTHEPTAAHVSRPQKEIEDFAREIEKFVAEQFPIAYKYFNENGRVAP